MTGKNNQIQSVTSAVPTGTFSPTASSLAGWDANQNMSAHNFIDGYTTTVMAAGVTTLTVSSSKYQYFTGASTAQSVKLPVASTLVLGQQFVIINASSSGSGAYLSVFTSSGSDYIQILQPNSGPLIVTCILTSGTTAASWSISQGLYIDLSYNYFLGYGAGRSIAGGGENVAIGQHSSEQLTTGNYNVTLGPSAGQSNQTGSYNVFIGYEPAATCSSSIASAIVIGYDSGANLSANNSIIIGAQSLGNHNGSNPNTIVGSTAFQSLTTGSYNTGLGTAVGNNLGGSESSNILIGYATIGNTGISNSIIIGNGTGTGAGQISTTYMRGITGGVLSAGSPKPYLVLCDNSSDQLVSPTPVAANTASSTFGSLAVGTALQNTANYPILVNVSMDVTSSTGAVILVGVGSTNTPTAQAITDSFTVATATPYGFSFVVPSKFYAKVTTTGTIVVGAITTFASQIG